jgi:hypothetical protein
VVIFCASAWSILAIFISRAWEELAGLTASGKALRDQWEPYRPPTVYTTLQEAEQELPIIAAFSTKKYLITWCEQYSALCSTYGYQPKWIEDWDGSPKHIQRIVASLRGSFRTIQTHYPYLHTSGHGSP